MASIYERLLGLGALSPQTAAILRGQAPVPSRNPRDPRIDQQFMNANAQPPALAQAMAPAPAPAPGQPAFNLSQVPTAGESYDMPDVQAELEQANAQAAEAASPMAQAMGDSGASGGGILDSMGIKTDNFGRRLANALMAAGSTDPGKTLSTLLAQDEAIRKARSESSKNKVTPLQGGAFSLIQKPDGTTEIVKNDAVATYAQQSAAQELANKILLEDAKAIAAGRREAGKEQVKTAGDSATTAYNAAELTRIIDALGQTNTASGPVVGNLPKIVRDTFFPEGTSLQDSAERIIQASLRQTLGAQFTEKEGARFLERAYNPRMSEAENARRLRTVLQEIVGIQSNKDAALEYMKKNGTLDGFKPATAAPPTATTNGATPVPGASSRFKASSQYFK